MSKQITILFLAIWLVGCQNAAQTAESSPTPDVTTTAVLPTATATAVPTETAVVPTPSAEPTFTPSPEPTATVEPSIAPEVEAYLNEALDLIEENALNTDRVDWEETREEALAGLEQATQTDETYEAIRAVLLKLGDNHSFFFTPERAAAFATSTTLNNPPASSDLLSERLGYINIPTYAGWEETAAVAHAEDIQAQLAALAAERPCGWIVDLRENGGGNMYPMLAGLAPIFEDGVLGYFVSQHGDAVPWSVEQGEIYQDGMLMVNVAETADLGIADAPTAVLTGSWTASSGEAVAISFIGRPNTQLFGVPTAGGSTANELIELSDGAMIALTTAVMADRNQKPYGREVPPDVVVRFGGELDTAIAWLLDQPNCQP